ncbi:MAG: hypothetical protein ACM3SR_08405 [Ignavibacteriales bacterium]
MRKIFISAVVVIGLIFVDEVSSFASDIKAGQSEMKGNAQDVTQLSGKVTDINSQSLMLKDQKGIIHQIIPAEPSEISKIKVGDNVTVDMRNSHCDQQNRQYHQLRSCI